jgi:hypothetical protein
MDSDYVNESHNFLNNTNRKGEDDRNQKNLLCIFPDDLKQFYGEPTDYIRVHNEVGKLCFLSFIPDRSVV